MIVILCVFVLYFYFHFRLLFPSKKGRFLSLVFVAALFLLALPGGRSQIFGAIGSAVVVFISNFLVLWLFLDLVLLFYRLIRRKPFRGKNYKILLWSFTGFGVFVSVLFLIVGYFNNQKLEIRHETYTLERLQEPLRVLFFSDSHFDAVFRKEKLERLVHLVDSTAADVVFFGGDLSDVSDTFLNDRGFDSLFREIRAPLGFFGVVGNHEGYLFSRGIDLLQWMRNNEMTLLIDSTVCLPEFCVTGRVDPQTSRHIAAPRLPLSQIAPSLEEIGSKPWLLLDHQPLGVAKDEKPGRLPDFAFSGHTHGGQFFPWTLVIGWVWDVYAGYGKLTGVPWEVTTGMDSWGPPVRVGSSVEVLLVDFLPEN